jgi:hypothetical protein
MLFSLQWQLSILYPRFSNMEEKTFFKTSLHTFLIAEVNHEVKLFIVCV